MIKFFLSQMDYILFVYGLSFIVIAVISLLLFVSHKEKWLWKWLAWFGFFQGIYAWLNLLTLHTISNEIFNVVTIFFLIVSLVCFFESGRWYIEKSYGRLFSRWVYIPAFLLLILGWHLDGITGVNVFSRYIFGAIGGLLVAFVFFKVSKTNIFKRTRSSFVLPQVIILVLFSLSQIIVPYAKFPPANFINQDAFFQVTGIPIQLIRALVILISALFLWLYFRSAEVLPVASKSKKEKYIIAGLVYVILFFGWIITEQIGEYYKKEINHNLLRDAKIVSSAVNPRRIKNLSGSDADIGKEDYERIKEQLFEVLKSSPEQRYAYLLGYKDGKIFFYVDAEPVDSSGFAPPGESYKDFPLELISCFVKGDSKVIGPYKDKWGDWVSAFVPVRDFQTKEILAVLGVDTMVSKWENLVYNYRLSGIAISFILFVFFGVFVLIIQLRIISAEALVENEIKFRKLFENSFDAVMMLDSRGIFDFNPAALRMFRITDKNKIIGLNPGILSPPHQPDGMDSVALASRRINEAMENGSCQFEWLHQRSDGSNFITEVRLSAFDLFGRSVVQAIVLDISERKRQEEKIRQAAEEWQRTFDSIPDLVFIMDTESHIVKANKAFIDIFGENGKPDNFIGKKCYEIIHKSTEHWPTCPLKGTIDSRKSVTAEVDDLQIGRPLLVTTAAVLDDAGNVINIVHSAKDITEIKKAQVALQEANKKLEEINLRKSIFVANVSHEFKNPLAIINESLGLIIDRIAGEISQKQESLIRTAKENIERLTRLVTDLLDVSKIESGKMGLRKEQLDISVLLKEILPVYEREIWKKQLSLKEEVAAGAGLVWADRDKLTEVIINLLNNAIKYTLPGGSIDIKLSGVEKEIRFEIFNSGEGIPDEYKEKIFDKFERITSEKEEGTGLGLPIAKDIIELHKGKLWVESEFGKGSKFIFTLPRA
ncbi:MAG: ATP-binding protein [Candidatus Omnitrophica bacterium]|nr:ATP-binding protein [Candidatus Omnitrophota bacterium]